MTGMSRVLSDIADLGAQYGAFRSCVASAQAFARSASAVRKSRPSTNEVLGMATVNPTREHIGVLERETPDDKPVVMVNLLKFREVAEYPPGERAGGSGKDAYARYSKAVTALLWEVGGQPLWMGKVRAGVIVPDGESWDEVLLIHYPSRRAFLRMVKSAPYQAIMHHRTAALADSRLIETRAVRLPKLVLVAVRGLVRVKALFWPQLPR
jgi:uncharacterized protein (DUF1330 family)